MAPPDDDDVRNPYDVSWLDDIREAFGSHKPEEEDDESLFEIRIPPWIIAALIGVAVAIAFVIYLIAEYLIVSAVEIDWDVVYAFFGSGSGRLLGSAIVVIAGIVLYRLRCWNQAVYGLCEVAVASVGGWVAMGNFGNKNQLQQDGGVLAAWIGVLAACYVVVRGLVNLMDGVKVKKREDEDGDETASMVT